MSESTDDAWFEALYRRNAPSVLTYARRRLRDPQDSEDVVVEVFAVAWRRRTDLPADPLPWLYATAANVIAHMTRAQTRRGRLSAKLASQPDVVLAPQEAVDNGEPLRVAMTQLAESDQEVLRLWAWEDLDGPRLAQALGCSPGTARTRLHRARTRLRTALTALMPEEGTA
jgi:RNA polymerase sigma-70 factor (ECF subfamily)